IRSRSESNGPESTPTSCGSRRRLAHPGDGGTIDQYPDVVAGGIDRKHEEKRFDGRKSRGEAGDALTVLELDLDQRKAPGAGVAGVERGALLVAGVAHEILDEEERLELRQFDLHHLATVRRLDVAGRASRIHIEARPLHHATIDITSDHLVG